MHHPFRASRAVLLVVAFLLPCHAVLAQTLQQRLVREHSSVERSPVVLTSSLFMVDEVEPNNDPSMAQLLEEASPLTLNGDISVDDVGSLVVEFQGDAGSDDMEDLFRITTTDAGLEISLTNSSADCDLYLIPESSITETSFDLIAASLRVGVTDEGIDQTAEGDPIPADTYIIGVAIFDSAPVQNQTSYTLTITGSISTDIADEAEVPTQFALGQNYPNPFNPETRIQYEVPTNTAVRLEVFNLLGRKVRTLVNEGRATGVYSVTWDGTTDAGTSVATGVYVYRLQAGSFSQSRTMVLLQ
jgi:hypothetical protein